MNDAIWLFTVLPSWFFQTILAPLSASYLSAIPASGIVALAIGAVLAFRKRESFALFGLVPVALAHLFVGVAGAFRGQAPDSDWLTGGFLLTELLLVTALIIYARRSRLAAAFIAWFCLTYAFFAAFVGAMAFADIWL